MTNKSAINILRNISLWNLINGKEYNALQMAIKALSATPAEQTHEEWEWCTDCKEYDQEQHCCHRYCKVIRETVDEIKQAERTGHWIPVEYPTGVEAFGVKEMTAVALKCSECGEEVDISDGDFKLCPYCGARMVGDDNE